MRTRSGGEPVGPTGSARQQVPVRSLGALDQYRLQVTAEVLRREAAKEKGVAREGMRWHHATSLQDRVADRQAIEPCHVLGI